MRVRCSEVIPFLVIAIGVENIFVIANGVVCTSIDMPVKHRVAEGSRWPRRWRERHARFALNPDGDALTHTGLRQVGVPAAMSLCTELGTLLLGYLTSIPALKEFCLFASVGIIADFVLQVTLFSTVLSIDIRRMELSDLRHHRAMMDERRRSADYVQVAQRPAASSAPNHWPLCISNVRSLGLFRNPFLVKTLTVLLFMLALAVGLYRGTGAALSASLSERGVSGTPHELRYSYWRLLHEHYGLELRARYFEVLPTIAMRTSAMSRAVEPGPGVASGSTPASVVHVVAGYVANTVGAFVRPVRRAAYQYPEAAALAVVAGVILVAVIGFYSNQRRWIWRDEQQLHRPCAAPGPSCAGEAASAWLDAASEVKLLMLRGHAQDIECVCCDASFVASACLGRVVRVRALVDGSERASFVLPGDGAAWCMTFVADLLVIGCSDGTVVLFDRSQQSGTAARLHAHDGGVTCVAAATAERFYSAGLDGSLCVWRTHQRSSDTGAGRLVRTLAVAPQRICVLAADHERIVGGALDGLVPVYDAATLHRSLVLRGHAAAVRRLRLLGGDRLASGSADGVVYVWSLRTGAAQHRLVGHRGAILALDADANSVCLATASLDETVRLWSLSDGRCLRVMLDAVSGSACFLAGGGAVLAYGASASVHLLDAHDASLSRPREFRLDDASPIALIATPDADALVCHCADRLVVLRCAAAAALARKRA